MSTLRYAAITGWGEGLPPAVLTNDDLSTFLETNDEWISQRTGMKERRISHVSAIEMATLASRRALACAGLDASAIHEPVPGFAQTLAQPTTSFLDRLTPERSFARLNWTIHDSALRFAPHSVAGRTDLTPENVLGETFLRIERQTLRRLPSSGFGGTVAPPFLP